MEFLPIIRDLCEQEILKKVPVTPGGKRFAYELTDKTRELKSVLLLLVKWGVKHIPGTAMTR